MKDRRFGLSWALALWTVALGSFSCGDSADPLSKPVPGTALIFDLDAELTDPDRFFDAPYPSDLRLDDSGRPDLGGFPGPEPNATLDPIRKIAALRRGFPAIGGAYFRFDGTLAARSAEAVLRPSPDAPILLIDVTPDSPERGRLFATIASTPAPDPYVPTGLLAVAAAPGIVLRPGGTFAFVVLRSLGDSSGEPLGVPSVMARLRAGEVPTHPAGKSQSDLFAPLWPTLDAIGVLRSEVAAATVFTVGDVVAEMESLANEARRRHAVEIRDVRLEEVHPRFCELRGQLRLPQFQVGRPPFNTEGLFAYGDDGFPIVQREEDAPIVLSLPRIPMPDGGYPLAIYFHGSGGLAAQVVDRGPVIEPGGSPVPGLGPAHVLAAHGIATVGAALPLNPERLPGASSRAYLNLLNLAAYPDTFRQGTIEQRLILDALGRLRIDATLAADCPGLSLPASEPTFRLETEHLAAIGQSLGAQYVNMVGSTDARIGAVMPTGSGGLWSLTPLEARLVDGVDTRSFIPTLIGTPITTLDHLHPALQLLETAFEPADPLVFAARLSRRPLEGHPARSIYQPVGLDDPGFSDRIYAAMSLGHAVQQTGDVLWDGLQEALALDDLDGLAPYPVRGNLRSSDGRTYTGATVQVASDGLRDSHHVFAQLDDVKYQYGCFLASFFRGDVPHIVAPRPLDTPCP